MVVELTLGFEVVIKKIEVIQPLKILSSTNCIVLISEGIFEGGEANLLLDHNANEVRDSVLVCVLRRNLDMLITNLGFARFVIVDAVGV